MKLLQVKTLDFLSKFAPSTKFSVHGFVKGRSILTNAEAHCDRKPTFVLNLDLKDFFSTITFFRVRGVLMAGPFDFSYEVATVLAHLCTCQGILPQGACTSPFLSNLVCRSLDRDLLHLARRNSCTYTRYADDITFSFSSRDFKSLPFNICIFDGSVVALGDELISLINKHSFEVNDKKTRISSRYSRQEVTGLTINRFPNVQRKFVDSVRGALHAWTVYGYKAANKNWIERVQSSASKPIKERVWRRQTRKNKLPMLHNLIWGKLLYIRMIRSRHDELYNRLARKYNALLTLEMQQDKDFKAALLPISHEVHVKDQASQAVYIIEWMGDFVNANGKSEMVGSQGTAFAYRDNDIIITCEHVFRSELDSGEQVDFCNVTGATINIRCPSTGFESTATLMHKDVHRDIAVLKVNDKHKDMRHFVRSDVLASSETVAILLGFPNWSKGRKMSSLTTSVLSTYPRSGLPKIEVRDLIRKGNSGGPLVSESFGILGLAQEGATQSHGNNECLCVGELDEWLNSVGVK
ncbi:MAG: reverse transcriptase domain-containing protein [Comamonas sp.]|uniref:S1 family peptidase n=1 Tax=Comamonas sp. TaxID=34028 RepID=UPI003D14A71B